MPTIDGFDVSHFQGAITWTDLPLQDVKFCFVKATDGGTGKDNRFAANWAGANAVELIRGAYHFFRPGTAVAAQVANFINQVGALDLQDLPPVLDLEVPGDDQTAWLGIGMPQAANLVIDWLNQMEAATGRKPIVYTNRQFYTDVLGSDASLLKGYSLWFARFTTADDPGIPPDWDTWQFWQFTDQGKLSGIDSDLNVDLNRFNGSLDDLKAFVAASIVIGDEIPA
jgi:lysozyme